MLRMKSPMRCSVDLNQDKKSVAYEQLVENHAAGLFHYGFWLCNDRAEAECLVKSAFLRAWESIDRGGQNSVSKIELFRMQRLSYIPPFSQSAHETEASEPGTEPIDRERYRINSEISRLRRALEAISKKDREFLLLQVVGDFNCEEIASLCGISTQAVRAGIYNAKRQLVGV